MGVRDGLAHPFVRFTERKPPEIPDSAAHVGTFAKTDEDEGRRTLDLLDAADEVGRPFIMSRQVPAERVAILRKAFDETMKDPAFLADMEKQQLPVIPLTGTEAEAIVAKIGGASPAIVAKARQIYE